MNINHHADDSTLMAYAAGALPEGLSLVVAAHIENCPRCRSRQRTAEAVGGQLLGNMEPAAMQDNALDAVFTRIETAESEEGGKPLSRPSNGLPAVLGKLLPTGIEDIRWRSVAPGVKQFVLQGLECARGSVRLLSIAPGTTIPQHSHGGSELTLVLKGSFADEVGRFGPGDLADLDDTVEHQPVADTSETCICLIATDEKLRFNSLFSRMLQPLFGL